MRWNPDDSSIELLAADTSGGIIEPFVGDITQKTKLRPSSLDLLYISMVIHGFSGSQMAAFMAEAERLLKKHGRLAIVEIKKENTPFGPPLEIRVSPHELQAQVPLKPTALVDIGQYFYMQVFEK